MVASRPSPATCGCYAGSRREKFRFSYEDDFCGLIELAPGASALTPDEFCTLLRRVPGVLCVEPHPKGSKTAQGNAGNHLQELNWFVHSAKNPKVGVEFELTRNSHSNERGLPYTVTAMFKHQKSWTACFEAWRILQCALRGRMLMPSWVGNWCQYVFGKMKEEAESAAETSPMAPSALEGHAAVQGEKIFWRQVSMKKFTIPDTGQLWLSTDDEAHWFVIDPSGLQSTCGDWRTYQDNTNRVWWCCESKMIFFYQAVYLLP